MVEPSGQEKGESAPQGGVSGPLLANIDMHRYLRVWKVRGKEEQYRSRIVVHADDFVVLRHGKAAEALA